MQREGPDHAGEPQRGREGRVGEVFLVALRLGLTSFGGPIAHLGYFEEEYVRRRGWLDASGYAELLAVANILPGPTSSQVGIAIGTLRAGKLGGLAAWLGFTLPSAAIMIALGVGLRETDVSGAGWLQGLELAAAAVVLTAVIAMARSLAPDAPRVLLAAAAAALTLLWPGPAGQVACIAAAAALGIALSGRVGAPVPDLHLRFPIGRRLAIGSAVAFVGLLLGLPVLREATGSHAVALVDAFYRAGSLVFGGGHVVLPLLDQAVVETGWVSAEDFLAGYGAAQALPGPLFTFAGYLGAAEEPSPNGVAGGLIALGAVFLPSFLLLGAVLPAWSVVRTRPGVRAALWGVGAAVVGLLAAAFWDPVVATTISSVTDVVIAAALFLLLRLLPPWAVVVIAALLGAALL